MKTTGFLIFLIIVLTIYISINYYIYIRGYQALPDIRWLKISYSVLFLFLSLSYIIFRALSRLFYSDVTTAFEWIGSLWIGALIYFLLIVVLLDFSRFLNYLFDIYPSIIILNYSKVKLITLLISVSLVCFILMAGYINNLIPYVNRKEITINKNAGMLKRLNIVAISDIHLCNITAQSKLKKLVNEIKRIKPDIVLFAGDLLDEDPGPVIYFNRGEKLKELTAPLGVFAVLGNHEYIGGVEKTSKYIESLNINLLRDTVLKISEAFYLVGTEDRESKFYKGIQRKILSGLTDGLNKSLPVILLDHQPFGLDKNVEAGIDLQISGHTHHGQLWPVNLLINLIYEMGYGYKKKRNTHFFVSSGYGLWGPQVRTANRPEILNIIINFK
ncbi:MAG: metallophosphoesterase [Bacteroidia bacterium]|nr:metallophosphoesterase [Bacteroidia bacterium]